MDLINTTDIQANETNVNWYEDGEAANAAVLNRPTKQVAEVVNEVITKLQDNEVSVGLNAGKTNQGINAIAIGENAGQTNQGTNAIAIGENAGKTNQPANTIAIGENANPANAGDIVIKTTSNAINVNADGMTMNSYRGGNISLDGNANFGGTLSEKGQRVYSPNNKPTAATVGAVPTSRTVNGKPLTTNITLSATDVDARPSSWTPTVADVGAVPTSRTVNGKALSANISLSAADVGAVPTSRTVNGKALSANISLSAADVGARPSSWTPTVTEIGAVSNTDSRLTDSREWMAATITQAEAEAGTATTRRAFTAQRVRQAIVAWWNTSAMKTKLDGIQAGAQVNPAFGNTAGTACQGNDSRLSNSREWTAGTVTQAEAEAGTATHRLAWTPQRVRQAIAAYSAAKSHTHPWSQVTDKPNTFTPSAHTHTVAQVSGLGTAATRGVGTGSGNVMEVGAFGVGGAQFLYGGTANLNDQATFHKFAAWSTTESIENGWSNGIFLTFKGNVNRYAQLGFTDGDNDLRIRSGGNITNGGSWKAVHHTGNILTTTGQSTQYPMTQKAVTDQLATKAPSSHTHTWTQVTGQPATATRWPTWNEVTSKPIVQATGTSTTDVMSQKAVTDAINARAGSVPTTAGGVGTYMFARTVDSKPVKVDFGSTISGSRLRPSDATSHSSGGQMSGTWRCMGNATTTSNGTNGTLYVRIS